MQKIQLLHDYAGRLTNEQRLQPGVYDGDDPILMGLVFYLVENGHAVWVDEPTLEDLPDGAIVEYTEDALIPPNPPAVPAPARPAKAPVKPTKAKAPVKPTKAKARK